MSSGTARVRLNIPEGVDPGAVTGASDELLRAIEALSDADVTLRGDTVSIAGDPAEVELLTRVFQQGAVTGASDELLRAIEALSDADVTLRGDTVSIAGDPAEVELLTRVFQQLFAAAREGDRLRADDVERLIGALRREDARALRSHDDVLLTYHGCVRTTMCCSRITVRPSVPRPPVSAGTSRASATTP